MTKSKQLRDSFGTLLSFLLDCTSPGNARRGKGQERDKIFIFLLVNGQMRWCPRPVRSSGDGGGPFM